MKEFTDSHGKTWPITINGFTVKRCRDLLGIDLGEPSNGTPPLLSRLSDIAFVVDLLYVVCKPTADDKGLSDEQFAELLDGEVLANAHAKLMEEWADFFRKLRQPHKATMLAKQLAIVEAAMAEADKAMSSQAFDDLVERKKAELGERFANLLASSESSQDRTPSES